MSPAHRRAATLVVVALVLAVGCVLAGRWQWNRHVQRDAAIAVVEANWAAAPVPVGDVLPTADADLTDDDVWRAVTLTGTYDVDGTVLLRNRPTGGQPAYHVLVPLVRSAGTAPADEPTVLVVDRGWVPTGEDASAAVEVPAPPVGEVTVTVRLRQDEAASDRDAPAGQVQAIDTAQVLAAGGTGLDPADAYPAYGSLVAEDPAPAVALGSLPQPSTDPGSHLSYAFQWWTFALGALVGFGVLARRELRDTEPGTVGPGDEVGAGARGGGGRPAPQRRRPSAEDEEDALIDAQLDPTASALGGEVRPGR